MTATKCGWVQKSYQTKGLDPLGTQAPSINIYGQLLPGITNVTDRARYYSFYPWMVWAYEQLPGDKTQPAFVEWVRQADCLFTMIGIRHSMISGIGDPAQHEKGLVGNRTLNQVIKNLTPNDSIQLSDYSTQDEGNKLRYFKAPLGGLKQYYIGTFDNLGIMTSIGSAVANTKEKGCLLAEAMDATVDRSKFTKTILSNNVTLNDLDDLSSFCPCKLTNSTAEHTALADLFFEHNNTPTDQGIQRRNSLVLMLDLVDQLSKDEDNDKTDFNQAAFRGCTYAGALPHDREWNLPPTLNTTRQQWGVYQKHELLSVAVQSIFLVSLQELSEQSKVLFTTEDFIQWFERQESVIKASEDIGEGSHSSVLSNIKSSIPSLSNWKHEEHEISLANLALAAQDQIQLPEERSILLSIAGKILLILAARDNGTEPAYAPLIFPDDYLSLYPINLDSLRNLSINQWSTQSISQWLAWVAGYWGIEAHLRVALRKLRYQSNDTFHVIPTDQGFAVNYIPAPTYTLPRFSQAIQILEDVGAITSKFGAPGASLTPLGVELLESSHA